MFILKPNGSLFEHFSVTGHLVCISNILLPGIITGVIYHDLKSIFKYDPILNSREVFCIKTDPKIEKWQLKNKNK